MNVLIRALIKERALSKSSLLKKYQDFDGNSYLEKYSDVKASGINPLIHYIVYGRDEGRTYILKNSKVKTEGSSLEKFLEKYQDFDASSYLEKYPDVKASGTDPLVHYVQYGRNEGREYTYKETKKKFNQGREFSSEELLTIPRDKFVIVTPYCVLYIANHIKTLLEKVGIQSQIVFTESQPENYERKFHIILCPQELRHLPKYYFVYQLEQSVSSRYFTEEYISILNNSIAILDYSMRNVEFLIDEKGFNWKKIFFVPVGFNCQSDFDAQFDDEYQYDIIFYGDTRNERRRLILDQLKTKYKLKEICGSYGEALKCEIHKAKIVLNIHYYDNAILETPRIYEALSDGKFVVSESSIDIDQHEEIQDIVYFADQGSLKDLCSAIDKALSDFNNDHYQVLNKVREKSIKNNNFEFYFLRFLLNFDFINYDVFFNVCGNYFKINNSNICLSLKESTKRGNWFRNTAEVNTQFFPALRHEIGWKGCAYSYKFLATKALQQNIENLLICEDDVLFGQDFAKRFSIVKSLLRFNEDWDVYSGLITDIDKDMKIFKVFTYKGERFAIIDKMVCMVFNIYKKKALSALADWNENNGDQRENQIDQYLKRQEHIKVLINDEFLVDHAENLDSTLWGKKNGELYTKLISDAKHKLKMMIYQHLWSMQQSKVEDDD